MKRSTKSAAPVCYWCQTPIPGESGYRGTPPEELALPAGAGVVVCSPACPERPEDAQVYLARPWKPVT